MITFFLLIGFSQFLFELSILEIAQYLSTPFHQKCLSWIPLQESGSEIRRALLCGQNILDLDLKRKLTEVGLIHLVVVSGAHLEFLSRALQKLKTPKPLIILVLGTFLLVSNFQAPAVRSFLDLLVGRSVRHNSILWSSLLALCLFPEWIQSLSFWMSLCAATIIRLPRFFLDQDHPLYELNSQILIYFFFLPITLFLIPLGPFSIFLNLIFATWLGALWIPLALIPKSDSLFSTFTNLLPDSSLTVDSGRSQYLAFLIFLIFYSGGLVCYEIYKKRQERQFSLY